MAKREVLGTCKCPECGFEDAEVKAQKNGKAYRWCPECNAQYFTRCDATHGRLMAKIGRAVPVTDTGKAAEQAPVAEPEIKVPADFEVPPAKPKSGMAAALDIFNLGGTKQ